MSVHHAIKGFPISNCRFASIEDACPAERLRASLAKSEALVRYWDEVLHRSHTMDLLVVARDNAANIMRRLTPRQREIMEMVVAGVPSKNIAADLHISQRTVENHRAAIMKRTCSKNIPELARMALAASLSDGAGLDVHPGAVAISAKGKNSGQTAASLRDGAGEMSFKTD
jgi:DNA-binding CsgD family transcriptional regulator